MTKENGKKTNLYSHQFLKNWVARKRGNKHIIMKFHSKEWKNNEIKAKRENKS